MSSLSITDTKFPIDIEYPYLPSQGIQSHKQIRNELIKSIALTALKELAISLAMAAVTCAFVASPIGMAMLVISAVALPIFNLALRSMSAGIYLACISGKTKTDCDNTSAEIAQFFVELVEWIAPINLSILNLTTRDLIIHEGGHALAAKLLLKEARPRIEVFPFLGGVTRFYITELSKVGEFFGQKNVRLIISGAGPAAAILASTLDIGIAHQCRHKYPRLSRYLNVFASINILRHLSYAFSSFSPMAQKTPGHDFVILWAGGIHPYASMAGMIALPLIVKTSLFILEKCS